MSIVGAFALGGVGSESAAPTGSRVVRLAVPAGRVPMTQVHVFDATNIGEGNVVFVHRTSSRSPLPVLASEGPGSHEQSLEASHKHCLKRPTAPASSTILPVAGGCSPAERSPWHPTRLTWRLGSVLLPRRVDCHLARSPDNASAAHGRGRRKRRER
jgi:hypothetical protein